jgi:uncharacterized damage-inducible protein DinB
MQLKDYLVEAFGFNDITNKKLLLKIKLLDDEDESVRFFSHIINCQNKWLARIMQDPDAYQMSWWDPVYGIYQLEDEWNKSLKQWLNYIDATSEEQLLSEVEFTGFDGARWAATPKDIILQLNYHSVHHRAQIQTIIRHQGVEPDFVDYIGTKYRRIG